MWPIIVLIIAACVGILIITICKREWDKEKKMLEEETKYTEIWWEKQKEKMFHDMRDEDNKDNLL